MGKEFSPMNINTLERLIMSAELKGDSASIEKLLSEYNRMRPVINSRMKGLERSGFTNISPYGRIRGVIDEYADTKYLPVIKDAGEDFEMLRAFLRQGRIFLNSKVSTAAKAKKYYERRVEYWNERTKTNVSSLVYSGVLDALLSSPLYDSDEVIDVISTMANEDIDLNSVLQRIESLAEGERIYESLF